MKRQTNVPGGREAPGANSVAMPNAVERTAHAADAESDVSPAAAGRLRRRHRSGESAGDSRALAKHSEDFAEVEWGQRFKFSQAQAAIIEVLWHEWERSGQAMFEYTVLKKAREIYTRRWDKSPFESNRIADLFAKHPAYRIMLEPSNGRWKLKPAR